MVEGMFRAAYGGSQVLRTILPTTVLAACGAPHAQPARARVDGPFAPAAVAGPYASIDAWCAALKAREPSPNGEPHACLHYEPLISEGVSHVPRAALVAFDDQPTWGPSCGLAFEVGGRWWIDERTELYCMAPPDRKSSILAFAIELEWRDVISGAPRGEAVGDELVLRASWSRRGLDETFDKQDMIVCGVGTSGVPRCTAVIPITHGGGPFKATSFRPQIAADGMLRFSIDDPDGQSGSPADYEPSSLRFP